MNNSLQRRRYKLKESLTNPVSSDDLPYLAQAEEEPYRRSRSSRPANAVANSQPILKSRFNEMFGKRSGHLKPDMTKEQLPSLNKEIVPRLMPSNHSLKQLSRPIELPGKQSRGSPAFSDARLLPLERNSFESVQTDRLADNASKQKDKLLRLLANDSTLPKILTTTRVPRGVAERSDRDPKKYSINNMSYMTKNTSHLQVSLHKEAPVKLEYYLKKLEISSRLAHAAMSQGFLDHFQKNYSDLKSTKTDKLIVDYHLKQVQLPPSVHEHLLVLDLDETLVHCCNFDQRTNKDTVTLPLKSAQGVYQGMIKFNVRPGVEKFLKTMAEHYQIVVFTASDRQYAKTILNYIDPEQAVCKLLTRDSCSFTRAGNVVKDLRVFKDRELSRMVLVDNLVKCSLPQLDNSVPILPYINDEKDAELEELSHFLLKLSSETNIPVFLRRYFKFHRYPSSPSHNNLLDEIVNQVL